MTTVRAFDPYARSKRNHPSAQPALVAVDRGEEPEAPEAVVLAFRRPAEPDEAGDLAGAR